MYSNREVFHFESESKSRIFITVKAFLSSFHDDCAAYIVEERVWGVYRTGD